MGAFVNTDTKENVEKSFYAYNEASFTSVKSNGGVEYPPQTILIKEKRNNGWWRIQTWEGDKWINLNGEKKYVEKLFYTYNEPSFVSSKGGQGQVFSAQELLVIDGTTSGWLKIISYEGEKWINPNGEKKYVEKSFYTYNEPSFVSQKGNGGQAFPAQEVLVIDGTTNGWLKIISYEGEKWINPNASEVSGVIELALKQLGKPYVFGAAGPNSFDCSGFIYYVYKNNGYSISRNSVEGYWPMVIKINDPQPGDLVFLQNTYKPGPSHMGIYLGNGEFIHAESEKTGVVRGNVFSSYNQKHFLGYGRFKK
ncbi:C40 family peptidase [Bacillus tropicus]|uniref:C40 family peptidase n=1 Tax=Bacillus tropicus TaxID=2026188 RepID=UPI003D1A0943